MSSTSSTFVYVLLLQNNKYYIGKTSNPNFRLAQHFNFNGSAWTKKYKPIRLVKLIPNCDKYDEDKYTKKYMGKYGINNVRGGAYCSMVLSREENFQIKKELNSATDICYRCGQSGHFAAQCPFESESESESESVPFFEYRTSNQRCYRCGRVGHYVQDCYATRHARGFYLE